MESFSITHINELSVSDAKEYVKRYFYPLSSGLHVQVDYDEDGKPVYEIKEDKVIKSVYFNRLAKVIQDFYFKEYDQIKTLTCELNKPFVFGKFINTCPSFKHEAKQYCDFPAEVKSKVDMMLSFLKEVWASNNELQYQFIIKWFSNMARGGKNQSVLYLRAEQGIGKSTFTDFLRKHVIGSKLCVQSGSQPLISQFNAILFCKLLVIFEELENFSTNQWQGVSTRLKRDTTSDTCTYEDKFQKAFTAKNISNYIINSNVDAIKDDDGRRYFILDLSNKRKGDFAYFKTIYDNCMNDTVGEAFFAYLMTIDLTGYHDQDFPTTKAKEDAIVKRLDTVIRYLKDKYILKRKAFDTNLKDAFSEYESYCELDGSKSCCKIEFNKRLETLNIKSYKSNGIHNKFKVSTEMLEELATKNKWMHSTDVYEEEQAPSDLDLVDPKDKQILDLKNEIEELKKQLAVNNLDVGIVDTPETIIILTPEQCMMNELKKQQAWIAGIQKELKPKKKKKKKEEDPVKFELFLEDLDELCN